MSWILRSVALELLDLLRNAQHHVHLLLRRHVDQRVDEPGDEGTQHKEVDLLLGVPGEIQKLQRCLRNIQSVLRDAEKRRIEDEGVNDWLMELKDVMYDADDECRMEAEKCTPGESISHRMALKDVMYDADGECRMEAEKCTPGEPISHRMAVRMPETENLSY
ncbi:hypothetical protein B296_00020010 [Ensete ventricosum]|uniref:Disease resistance N-terminal domain-containing protein n=1 Tax=Ensete ventricosum TaxID=4639 RepID=A0A426Z5J7_ENSVE|nr:hypothetical protein B296_00020010 [Ensete ventricosum]